MPRLLIAIICVSIVFSIATDCQGQAEVVRSKSRLDQEFANMIQPLLHKYCIDCHAPASMKGLDFMAAKSMADVVSLKGLFASVGEQMESHAMPPKNLDQPTDTERKMVTDWIKSTLKLQPSDTDRIAKYVVETYQDKQGNLWFGTMHEGAARYDGKRLVYFSKSEGLPSTAVPSFAEDSSGNLWVGTQAGVCRFNGTSFTRFGSAHGLPDSSDPSAMAWATVQADLAGNIWATVGNHVYRFDGKSFQEFKLPIDLKKIDSYAIVPGRAVLAFQAKNGDLWFSTDGCGALKYDGSSFSHFTKKDGLCSNNVTSIMEDQQGNLWFTCIQSYQPKMTGDGGVCRFDGQTFTQFSDTQGLSKNDIYTIYETNSGDIWIGASGVGAYRYDGKSFTLFSETDKQHWTRNFGIQGILEDKNGTLWFGFSGGLFRFNGKSFFNITKKGPWKTTGAEPLPNR